MILHILTETGILITALWVLIGVYAYMVITNK